MPVGRVGEAHYQLAGVVLGLPNALGQRLIPCFGFDNRQLDVAVFEDIVCGQRLATLASSFQATERNRILAPDATAFDDAPAGSGQCGVDVFGAGFGFVHGAGWFQMTSQTR